MREETRETFSQSPRGFPLPEEPEMDDNLQAREKEPLKKAIWIAFDLGIDGDYDGMYSWLDDHEAKECGDNFAFLWFEVKDDLLKEMKADIKTKVSSLLKKSRNNRVYVVYRTEKGGIKGTFLFGTRKKPPWTGYGVGEETEIFDEEQW